MSCYYKFSAEEKAWIEQFKKVMAKAPDTLFLVVDKQIEVHATDEDDRPIVDDDGKITGDTNDYDVIESPIHFRMPDDEYELPDNWEPSWDAPTQSELLDRQFELQKIK